jgi:RluA family pseudouridine synthase
MTVLEKKFQEDAFHATYQVDLHHQGMRFDQFLLTHMKGHSREQIKKKIACGEIVITNRSSAMRPSSKLHLGDEIAVVIHKENHEDEFWRSEKIELVRDYETVYEDQDLIVINKPPFMATHPTGKHMFHCATVLLGQKYGKTIHSCHRIDRETSGVLVLGKNSNTAMEVSTSFENDLVRKVYFWISKHKPDRLKDDSFWARERLGANETGLRKVITKYFPTDSTEGKEAETFYKVLGGNEHYSYGLAFPRTGRTHQIRVHAMVKGYPLLGDKLYLGGYEMFQRFKDNLASEEDHDLMELPRHALHAVALNIPYKGERKILQARMPKDFLAWFNQRIPGVCPTELDQVIAGEIAAYFAKFF